MYFPTKAIIKISWQKHNKFNFFHKIDEDIKNYSKPIQNTDVFLQQLSQTNKSTKSYTSDTDYHCNHLFKSIIMLPAAITE